MSSQPWAEPDIERKRNEGGEIPHVLPIIR
jgi:hypothetical protein